MRARKRPVRHKWVYTIKYKADETLERCKTRLVAKGYRDWWLKDILIHMAWII